jgi:hypothetical protein
MLVHEGGQTSFAVSTEESRPLLNGVLWQLADEEMRRVVGTRPAGVLLIRAAGRNSTGGGSRPNSPSARSPALVRANQLRGVERYARNVRCPLETREGHSGPRVLPRARGAVMSPTPL